MRFDAVLFDFDDTLWDSMAARVDALSQTLARHSIVSPTPLEFFRSVGGGDFRGGLTKLAEGLALEVDLYEQYRSVYWTRNLDTTAFFPGVTELLIGIQARQLPMGIVSTKGRAEPVIGGVRFGFSAELGALSAADFFGALIGLEDVTRVKPDPEGILLAAGKLRVDPARVLFVGDSTADILAANAASATSCWAEWGQMTNELVGVTPHLAAAVPGDVLSFLD